jgi:type VI protein secretion system component Hcp
LYIEDDHGEQIKGESQDLVFKECIELVKFDFDAISDVDTTELFNEETQEWRKNMFADDFFGGGGSFGAIAMNMGDEEATARDSFTFSVSKLYDKASPALFLNYCQATRRNRAAVPFKYAAVYIRLAGVASDPDKDWEEQSYIVMEFENLHVTKYSIKHEQETNIPDEDLTFYFESYVMKYRKQEAEGHMGSDLVQKGFDFLTLSPKPS